MQVSRESEGEGVVIHPNDGRQDVLPEHRDRVFGLFHRHDVNTTGTGNRLAIVPRVAERHGDRARVEDGRSAAPTLL